MATYELTPDQLYEIERKEERVQQTLGEIDEAQSLGVTNSADLRVLQSNVSYRIAKNIGADPVKLSRIMSSGPLPGATAMMKNSLETAAEEEQNDDLRNAAEVSAALHEDGPAALRHDGYESYRAYEEKAEKVTDRNSAEAFANSFRRAQEISESTPDALVYDANLANASGISLAMLRSDPDLRKAAKMRAEYLKGKIPLPEKVRYAADNNMYSYQFLLRPENLALITDKPDSLIESEGVFATATLGYMLGDAQQRLGRLRMRQLLGEGDAAAEVEIEKIKGEMEGMFQRVPAGLFDKAVFGAGKLTAQRRDQIARGAYLASAGTLVVGVGLMTGGIGAAPAGALLGAGGTAGLGAVGLASKVASTGFMVGSAYEGFIMEAGLAYDELKEFRDENGNPLEDSIARAGAFIVGAINAGLEAAQLSVFIKSFPGVSKVLSQTVIKQVMADPSFRAFLGAAGKAAIQYAGTLFEESFTEVLQETSNIVVGEAAKKISSGNFRGTTKEEAIERLAETFASSMIEFSIPMIPGPLMGGVNNMYQMSRQREQKLNRAKVMSNTLSILSNHAKNNPMTKRSPQKMREFIAGMSDHYGYQQKTVYVPASAVQEYMNTHNLNQEQRMVIMEDLFGSNMNDLSSSVASGADLAIPVENIAVAAGIDSELIDTLTAQFKAEPEGFAIGNINIAAEDHKNKLRIESAVADAMALGSMTEEELQTKAREVGLDRVYLPAEAVRTFYQELNDAAGAEGLSETLEALGVSEAEYNKALENGDDIEISTSRLISGKISSSVYEKLRESVRVEPQAMSLRDAVKYENESSVLYSREEAAGWRTYAEKQLDAFESGLKVQANVKAQMLLAGYSDVVSDSSAKIFTSRIMISAKRLGIDPLDYFKAYANMEFVRGTAGGDLKQPLMTNLPLDTEITPVRGEQVFNDKPIWQIRKNFPEAVKEKIRGAFKAGVVNENTGLKWHLGSDGLKHIMATAGKVEYDISERYVLFNAVNSLPELAERAIRVEVHEDIKSKTLKHPNDSGQGVLSKIHRFLVPFMDDNETIHILKITGKEYRGGFMPDEISLYDQKRVKSIEIKTKSLNESSSSSAHQTARDESVSTAIRPTSDQDFVVSIPEAVGGVKGRDGGEVKTKSLNEGSSSSAHQTTQGESASTATRPTSDQDFVYVSIPEMVSGVKGRDGGEVKTKSLNEGSSSSARQPARDGSNMIGNRPTPEQDFVISLREMVSGVKGSDGNMYLQGAYHGSAAKFDKFSTDFIGTGEGALAYGWGIYATDTRGIAESYRKNDLKRKGKSHRYGDYVLQGAIEGKSIDYSGSDGIEGYLYDQAKKTQETKFALASHLLSYVNTAVQERNIVEAADVKKIIDDEFRNDTEWRGQLKKNNKISDVEIDDTFKLIDDLSMNLRKREDALPGQVYQVEIPDDVGQYLLWDKPLSEQHEKTQAAIKKDIQQLTEVTKIDDSDAPEGMDEYQLVIGGARGKLTYFAVEHGANNEVMNNAIWETIDDFEGGEFYSLISDYLGSDKAASEALLSRGIIGNKYLDGNSRSSGKGSYNYVLFHDEAIDIQKTYYQSAYHDPQRKILGTIDRRYFAAIEAGDMETAQRIVDDQARKNGYISNTDYRLNHRAPSHHDADVSVSLEKVLESDIVPGDFWTHPHYYMPNNYVPVFRRVLSALKSKEQTITMYRAIPKGVKENSFRNGDWITPSLDYARLEGEGIPGGHRIIEQTVNLKDVWWDADSINEFGYDDGREYAYKNTKNNRKLTDAVVRDKSGNIVPPSKRFNQRRMETFYQAMVDGIDGNEQVPVLDITALVPKAKRKSGAKLLKYLESLIEEQYETLNKEASVIIRGQYKVGGKKRNPVKHTIYSKLRFVSRGTPDVRKAAITSIADLIQNSTLIEQIPVQSRKAGQGLAAYYRFYVPVQIGNKQYTIRLVMEETDETRSMNREKPLVQLYDIVADKVITETKESDTSIPEARNANGVQVPLPRSIRIKDMLENVKDSDGNYYFPPSELSQDSARGSITLPRTFGAGERIQITISPNADASTAIHEMAHFFLWEIDQLARVLPNDKDLQDDLFTIQDWLGYKEGQGAWTREQHEKFAMGFERYLSEGKAPSVGLLSAFRRFKKWLLDIYQSNLEQKVELTDSVRDVFGRMLATDEEIEAMSLIKPDITEQRSVTENLVAARGENLTRQQQESAKEGVLAQILKKHEQQQKILEFEKIRDAVQEEVLSMPVYRAIEAMKNSKEMKLSTDSLVREYDFDVFDGLPQDIHSSDGTAHADDVAAIFGYGSGDEMLQVIRTAPTLEQEIGARTKAVLDQRNGFIVDLKMAADDALHEAGTLEPLFAELEDISVAEETSQAEWDEMLKIDEEAKASRDNPKSRENVIAWIRKNGGLKYEHVINVFGEEDTRALAKRLGPGIWNKETGMGLDIAAESMTYEGAYFGGEQINADQEIFNILMGPDSPVSPLEVAWNEGFAAAREYAKSRREQSKATVAERKRVADERKTFRETMKTNAQIKADAVLSAAHDSVARLQHKQIEKKVKAYKAAEAAARQEYRNAVKQMNWEAARNAKDREILNRALAIEAKRASKDMARARARINNMLNRTKNNSQWISQEWMEQIDGLLVRFGLLVHKPYMDNTMGLDMWCESRERSGVPSPVAAWIRNATGRFNNWADMTVQSARDVGNAFAWLVHDGRESQRLSKAFANRNLDETAARLAAIIATNWQKAPAKKHEPQTSYNRTQKEIAQSKMSAVGNRLRKIEFIVKALDGGEKLGPVWDNIFKPMSKAQDKETSMSARYADEFAQIFNSTYSKAEQKQMRTEKYWKRIDKNLSKENLLAVALNMGNDSNRERLISGFEAGEAMISITETALSVKDWEFVQKIWDLNDSLWPEIATLQRDIVGFIPERIQPRKFQVHARGENGRPVVVTLRGGYYPIAYDKKASQNRFIRMMSEQETIQNYFETQWNTAYTKHGFTERRSKTTGLQLRLDLNVIPQHFMEVIHDLSYRKAVIDVNKIVRHKTFQAAVISTMGEEVYNQFQPWLQNIARDEDKAVHNSEVVAKWVRRRTQVVVLGLKAAVSLTQMLGWGPAVHELGALPLMKNIFYFYRNPLALASQAKEAWSKSEQMRSRSENRDRDLRSAMRDMHKRGKYDSMQESYFYFINLFDAGVVLPIWTTAYEKAIVDYGWEESKAIDYADSVVRTTQDIGTPKDLSAMQRGTSLQRLFTMFYNAVNTQLNMLIFEADMVRMGKGSPARIISALAWIVVVPAIAAELLRGQGPGGDMEDEDDNENIFVWIAKTSLMQAFALVPFVRDFSNAISSGRDYRATPATAPAEDAIKAINSYRRAYNAWREEDEINLRQVGSNTLMMLGYIFGLPAGQARITINAFLDWLEGEKEVKPQDFFLYRKR